jgi:hypothetical protein
MIIWHGIPRTDKREADHISISGKSRADVRRVAVRLLEPMLPKEVHRHIDEVLDREYSVFNIEARGFSFSGGHNTEFDDYVISVRRDPAPPGKRAIGP